MKFPFASMKRNPPAASVPPPAGPVDPVEAVLVYHEETKHHTHRFARSLGYLDWDTQPDPFRRFEGAAVVQLPLLPREPGPSYADCFIPGKINPLPVNLDSISRLFRNSMAISAWKQYGDSRWALRVNPSSGNLHPTEAYALLSGAGQFPCGVYHYCSRDHLLERRATLPEKVYAGLLESFPPGSFLVGLTSIHWREAWKYGERAYRYCQHDTGHALAALRVSAAILGWSLLMLEEMGDDEIASLLGLDRAPDFEEAEDEDPGLIAAVIPSREPVSARATVSSRAIVAMQDAEWSGHANRLSASHVEWEVIPVAARCGYKTRTTLTQTALPGTASSPPRQEQLSAETVVQQRRSAVSFDAVTGLSAEAFYHILSRTLPSRNPAVFDVFSRSVLATPRVHLGLFVHRVTGVDPGLYCLVRDPGREQVLKNAMNPEFEWAVPEGCDSPLFRLQRRDVRRLAAGVSCGQDIAGDGAFSLGMIAEMDDPVRKHGAWVYRRLFWECGVIGQILYLEAEAAGIRATGIGCFFDDPVHETFGLKGRAFQSLYHFTMGGPVEDTRITTEPAYE